MARIWLFGQDVDTDQILPGRYAPYMTSEESLAKYPFIEARPEFPKEVRTGDVIVAGGNFGCGSSREYAPRALKLAGIAAIIAPGFARIFFRNAINLGVPLFEVDLRTSVHDGDRCELRMEVPALDCEGVSLALPRPPDWVRLVWAEGGMVGYYRAHGRFPVETRA